MLKRSACLINGKIKNSSFPVKVLDQLLNTLYKQWWNIFSVTSVFLCCIMKSHFADKISSA